MLIFPRENIVFFAVPKTGSTSVERAFSRRAGVAIMQPPAAKHSTPRMFRAHLEPGLSLPPLGQFDSVAVVREPFDRLSSWYRYRRRDGIRNPNNSTKGIDFETFVTEAAQADPPARAKVGLQHKFLYSQDGTHLLVKHLFALHDIDALVGWLNTRLDTDFSIGTHNVSETMELKLSDAARAAYRARHPEEFALWDRVAGQA